MTRCSITCMEVGCTNKIYYTVKGGFDTMGDIEVPLYCERHRTEDGRHSAVREFRELIKPEPKPEPECLVILRCPSCKVRKTIPYQTWMKNPVQVCGCGKRMVYHKEKEI